MVFVRHNCDVSQEHTIRDKNNLLKNGFIIDMQNTLREIRVSRTYVSSECLLTIHDLLAYLACSTGTACSSSKVAGLIVYETFCYLWTSQVVGNIALATLAGGPFGGAS